MEYNPLISVIIPVFNVEKFLPQCIESVINQTYLSLEIILVNDGSTDSSGLICDEYKDKDFRIKVIHKENEGLSSARNIGIEISTGDYICFLDSDDWMDAETLEKAIDISMIYNSDIVFWSFIKEFENYQLEYKVNDITKDFFVYKYFELEKLKRRIVGLYKEELSIPIKTDAFISAWGKLYKSSLLKENFLKFFSTQIVGSEDVAFNISAFHFSKNIVYLNRCFNHYRMTNPNSLTKSHGNTLFFRYKNLYNVIFEFIEANNLSQEYKTALDNRFSLSLINNALSITGKRNNSSLLQKRNDLDSIINDKLFVKSIKNLQINHMPFKWRLFFSFARFGFTSLILFFTFCYRFIVNK